MTTAKWTINNTREQQDRFALSLLKDLMNEKSWLLV
jgi:hypothetical protein